MGYAEAHGMLVDDWYVDVGQRRDCPAAKRLLAAAASSEHGFDTVLVLSYARLSRVRLNTIMARCQLRDAGVRLVSEHGPYDSSMTRLVQEVVHAGLECARVQHW